MRASWTGTGQDRTVTTEPMTTEPMTTGLITAERLTIGPVTQDY